MTIQESFIPTLITILAIVTVLHIGACCLSACFPDDKYPSDKKANQSNQFSSPLDPNIALATVLLLNSNTCTCNPSI
ncbi:hypothetical protein K6025_00105 [Ehrlichia sp. JZT12]